FTSRRGILHRKQESLGEASTLHSQRLSLSMAMSLCTSIVIPGADLQGANGTNARARLICRVAMLNCSAPNNSVVAWSPDHAIMQKDHAKTEGGFPRGDSDGQGSSGFD